MTLRNRAGCRWASADPAPLSPSVFTLRLIRARPCRGNKDWYRVTNKIWDHHISSHCLRNHYEIIIPWSAENAGFEMSSHVPWSTWSMAQVQIWPRHRPFDSSSCKCLAGGLSLLGRRTRNIWNQDRDGRALHEFIELAIIDHQFEVLNSTLRFLDTSPLATGWVGGEYWNPLLSIDFHGAFIDMVQWCSSELGDDYK